VFAKFIAIDSPCVRYWPGNG